MIGELLIRGPDEHTSGKICKNRDDANELGTGSSYLYESPPARVSYAPIDLETFLCNRSITLSNGGALPSYL